MYYLYTNIIATKIRNVFTSRKPPTITLQAYLERIMKYTNIEDSTLIISLIYLDRMCELNIIQMNNYNIHR